MIYNIKKNDRFNFYPVVWNVFKILLIFKNYPDLKVV